jgi:Helix-loop-helix DNA-binding domain
MAFNKPVSVSPSPHPVTPSPSAMTGSVRAWRPHETPFDPGLHGQPVPEEQAVVRRPSTSSSHRDTDHSMDSPAQRKRPAPAITHSELIPSKRQRSQSTNTHSAPSISPVSAIGSSQSKPPLLTAQQKKANHILSEQKRRAKIRRGYDALCEVVPALKSAVLAEQEAMESKKKRGKQAKGASAADDGRAGPKSESIVLSQSTLNEARWTS